MDKIIQLREKLRNHYENIVLRPLLERNQEIMFQISESIYEDILKVLDNFIKENDEVGK
jgi:hypothetical protein